MGIQLGPVSATYIGKAQVAELAAGGLSLRGQIASNDVTILTAVAQQIRALSTDVDAPEIPVVFSDTADGAMAALAHLNGFYRVTSSSVSIPQGGIATGTAPVSDWRWSVDLQPVPDRAGPRIESILESVVRTNSVSIVGSSTKVDPWHAVPSSVLVYDDGSGQTLKPSNTVTTATGDIKWGYDTTNNPPRRVVSAWRCRPADWYRGAAIVERKWGTSTWLPVVGRDPSVQDGDLTWRISNGLIQFGPQAADATTFDLSCYRAGSWQSTTTIRFPVYASPPYSPTKYLSASSVSILRNSPAEVRVRFIGAISSVAPPAVVDLRLRRGQPWVDIRWAMPNSTTGLGQPDSLTISPSPSWSAIAGGGGQVATADANGNKLVQFYPVASSSAGTGANSWDTAIGFDISGFPADNTYIKGQYFAPSAEYVRFVGA